MSFPDDMGQLKAQVVEQLKQADGEGHSCTEEGRCLGERQRQWAPLEAWQVPYLVAR